MHRFHRRSTTLLTALLAGATLLAGCGGSDAAAPERLELAGGGTPAAGNRDAASPAMIAPGPTEYRLTGTLADLGRRADVYRLTARPIDDGTVRRIAAAFGLPTTGDNALVRLPDGSTWFGGPDGEAPLAPNGGSVTVFPGGPTPTVNFSTTTAPPDFSRSEPGASGGDSAGSTGSTDPTCGVLEDGTITECPIAGTEPLPLIDPDGAVVSPPTDGEPGTTETPPAVPDAAEAERIARAILDEAGVLDGPGWAESTVEVTETQAMTATVCAGDRIPCPSPPPYVVARTVTFAPNLDGAGLSGSTWSVTIGDGGIVEAAYGDWATIDPVGTYDTVGTEAAFSDLQDGTAVFPGPQPLMAEGGPAVGGPADSGAPVAEPEIPANDAGSGATPPDGGGASPGDPGTGVPEPMPVPGEPEPVVVKITGVSPGLMRWDTADAESPIAYLVPTYRFAVESGGFVEVLALTPDGFEIVSPTPPITVEPQPMPGEPKPVDPGLTPEPVPTSAAPEASGSSSGTASAEILGLTESEATDLLARNGEELRVVERDGEKLAVTRDYRDTRVNVVVLDGRVTEVTGRG